MKINTILSYSSKKAISQTANSTIDFKASKSTPGTSDRMITGGPRQAVDPTKCHTSVALEMREIVKYGRRCGSVKRMSKFAFGAPLLVMCEVSGSTPLRYSGQLQFVVVSHSHALNSVQMIQNQNQRVAVPMS